jgi:hypothetical protein
MRPYPLFSGIDGQDERGSSNYQSLQLNFRQHAFRGKDPQVLVIRFDWKPAIAKSAAVVVIVPE